jgi:DNA invertase Pin-like site-specific DNA recombinase
MWTATNEKWSGTKSRPRVTPADGGKRAGFFGSARLITGTDMKAYRYIRVSGRGQLNGDGPDRQRDACDKFFAQHGLEFAGEFFEKAVSGKREGMDRPSFREFIETHDAHVSQGLTPIGVIVVERMDRLARDLMVSEMLLKECRVRGIKVYACDHEALIDVASDAGDPTRKLIRQFMAALAEWQKSELVLKLAKARDRIRKTTGRCEGPLPYGATNGQRQVVNQIIALRDSSMTFQAVANFLNESALPSPTGKPWDRKTVHYQYSKHTMKGQTCAEHTPNT